mgnify:FL=1
MKRWQCGSQTLLVDIRAVAVVTKDIVEEGRMKRAQKKRRNTEEKRSDGKERVGRRKSE